MLTIDESEASKYTVSTIPNSGTPAIFDREGKTKQRRRGVQLLRKQNGTNLSLLGGHGDVLVLTVGECVFGIR